MDDDSFSIPVWALIPLLPKLGWWAGPYVIAGVTALISVQRHDRERNRPDIGDSLWFTEVLVANAIVAFWPLLAAIAVWAQFLAWRKERRYRPRNSN
jgi:hypothetical protein